MEICPCCKRKIPQSRDAEKKLKADRERVMLAIEVLSKYEPDTFSVAPPHLLIEAVLLERQRLRDAYNSPKKLWRIYRRNDKGGSYASL